MNSPDANKSSLQAEFEREIGNIQNSNLKLPMSVVITDIKMPMGSMVEFMLKWAIASIPVFIIFGMLISLPMLFLGMLVGG